MQNGPSSPGFDARAAIGAVPALLAQFENPRHHPARSRPPPGRPGRFALEPGALRSLRRATSGPNLVYGPGCAPPRAFPPWGFGPARRGRQGCCHGDPPSRHPAHPTSSASQQPRPTWSWGNPGLAPCAAGVSFGGGPGSLGRRLASLGSPRERAAQVPWVSSAGPAQLGARLPLVYGPGVPPPARPLSTRSCV